MDKSSSPGTTTSPCTCFRHRQCIFGLSRRYVSQCYAMPGQAASQSTQSISPSSTLSCLSLSLCLSTHGPECLIVETSPAGRAEEGRGGTRDDGPLSPLFTRVLLRGNTLARKNNADGAEAPFPLFSSSLLLFERRSVLCPTYRLPSLKEPRARARLSHALPTIGRMQRC